MRTLSSVDEQFQRLTAEYADRRRACESNVAHWRWATFCAYDPRPLYFESMGFPPGRFIRTPKPGQQYEYQYGFDAFGNVLIEREYNAFGFDETFFCKEDGLAIKYLRAPYCTAEAVLNLQYAQSRLDSVVHVGSQGANVEQYLWHAGTLAETRSWHSTRRGTELDHLQFAYWLRPIYEAPGKLLLVDKYIPAPDGSQTPPIVVRICERVGGRLVRYANGRLLDNSGVQWRPIPPCPAADAP